MFRQSIHNGMHHATSPNRIFPPFTAVNLALLEEQRRAKLVEKWMPVIRKCVEVTNRGREETQRFAMTCEEAYQESERSKDISHFSSVILPNIRRLFGYPLPAHVPLLRTIEEERELLRSEKQQIVHIAAGLGRRKLDFGEPTSEIDYQI